MNLFGKKTEETSTCGCGTTTSCGCGSSVAEAVCTCGGLSIKVLGSGCKKCHALYENACEAVKKLGLGIEPEYITDMAVVASYGVMSVPALVVNDQPVAMGKLLSADEIVELLQKLGL